RRHAALALAPARGPRPACGAPPPPRPGAARLRPRPGREGRPQGLAVVRPQRRRLLPRTPPRPPRPRRPARLAPVLEDPRRGDRPRCRLQGRPDLRPLGLRQVVAGQGGVVAPAGEARLGGVRRGDARGDRGPAVEGPPQDLPRPGPGPRARRDARGTPTGEDPPVRPEGAAGARPVRAVA